MPNVECPRCKRVCIAPVRAVLGNCPHCGEPYRAANSSRADRIKTRKSLPGLSAVGWFLAGGALVGYCLFLYQLGSNGRTGHPTAVDTSGLSVLDSEPIRIKEETWETWPKDDKGFDALRNETQVMLERNGTRSQSLPMSFEECLAFINRTVADIGEQPLTIVSTSDVRVVKWFAADGAVLVTCSRPDGKMVLTGRLGQ